MSHTIAQNFKANSLEVAKATTIKINGVDRTVDVDGDTPLLWVLARRVGPDRHQVRLRHGALRRLHRLEHAPPNAKLYGKTRRSQRLIAASTSGGFAAGA
jgi:hypothetical protein